MAGAKQAPLNSDHGHDFKEVALNRSCSIPTESEMENLSRALTDTS